MFVHALCGKMRPSDGGGGSVRPLSGGRRPARVLRRRRWVRAKPVGSWQQIALVDVSMLWHAGGAVSDEGILDGGTEPACSWLGVRGWMGSTGQQDRMRNWLGPGFDSRQLHGGVLRQCACWRVLTPSFGVNSALSTLKVTE